MMSHTPVKSSGIQEGQSPLVQVEQSSTAKLEICQICKNRKDEKIECLIIVKCNHSFHRACIENFLSHNNACPVCNLSCELEDLKRVSYPGKHSRPRGTSRGSYAGHQYSTRSVVQNLFHDSQTPSLAVGNTNVSRIAGNVVTESEDNTPQTIAPDPIETNSSYNASISEVQNPIQTTIDYTQINRMMEINLGRALRNFNSVPQNNVIPSIDYNRIDEMIQTSVSNIFQNLNLVSHTGQIQSQQPQNRSNLIIDTGQGEQINNSRNLHVQDSHLSRNRNVNLNLPSVLETNQPHPQNTSRPNDSNLRTPNFPISIALNPLQAQDFHQSQQSSNATSRGRPSSNFYSNPQFVPNSFSSAASFSSDKVTSIIQNWGLKFDGTSNGLYVEEFLYRLRSLTNDYFNGDFNFIRPNLHIVLAGKAKNWFWSYHKRAQSIVWEDFCSAIREQYKDFKSPFDIREEIRNRKQKPGESFDIYYESISSLLDRLPNPLSEIELIEIITRNLRPDIRHELLYQQIHSISHLRKLVQMRESFLNDEYVRRNFSARNPNTFVPRRHVAEIECENSDTNSKFEFQAEPNIDAINKTKSAPRCWNCDQQGHYFEDCLHEKTIFCYGCGAKNTYKPQCSTCLNRNSSKNSKISVPLKEQL